MAEVTTEGRIVSGKIVAIRRVNRYTLYNFLIQVTMESEGFQTFHQRTTVTERFLTPHFMSGFQDQTLSCGDCSSEFTFTSGEQEFYATKGFSAPRRCPTCREQKKSQRSTGTEVTCAQCGQKTVVPFVPRGDRPVLCRDCFTASKNS